MPGRPILPIAEYAFLSDCQTAALVARDGSIDWYCPGRFDEASVFGRLLDPEGGHWSLGPTAEAESRRTYLGPGLVLRTEHRTATGRVTVTDALPQRPGTKGHDLGLGAPGAIVRLVEGLEGEVELETEFAPRFEYGLSVPALDRRPPKKDDPREVGATGALGDEARDQRWALRAHIVASAGPAELELRTTVPLEIVNEAGMARARFTIAAGAHEWFVLRHVDAWVSGAWPRDDALDALDAATLIEGTLAAWASWDAEHVRYRGPAHELVKRSAAVLQGLTFGPSGGFVAAATTSLPERIGEDWNWDYRYAWLRDASLVMRAQWVAACPDEATGFFAWLVRSIGPPGKGRTQIMFGVGGERRLPESTMDTLSGYRDSRPVRVGNDAWRQRQLDVLGEVLDIALLLEEQLGDLNEGTKGLLIGLAEEAAESWRRPDAGMWEARDRERHYVSSKVMCWVALDRALQLDALGASEPQRARWSQERDAIREEVLRRAWSERADAYAGAFDSDELDASVLLLPLVGFLDADDERMRATILSVERVLSRDGLVRRWGDDPNAFLLCSFWLVECLALAGEAQRALDAFRHATALANDLGLLAEMADLRSGELLGNIPQAFSHAGLINAAWRLGQLGISEASASLEHAGARAAPSAGT